MRILILANYGMGLYKFRKELLQELVNKKYDVYFSLPEDEYVPMLEKIGCKYINTFLERRSKNPIKDLKLINFYKRTIKDIKPDIVLTYTIKPNIYGGIACNITKTPYITNITGLGTSIENKGLIQKITLSLYKIGLKRSSCVFFQNGKNRMFFKDKGIFLGKTRLIPGSGVNIDQHCIEDYPNHNAPIKVLFIGRIMKDKGIDELIQAAIEVKSVYSDVQFDIVGDSEEDYSKRLAELESLNIIKYYGRQDDIHSFIKNSHATVLPSYHEGMANVLLESASSGRPVLASKVSGCLETFDEGISGFGFDVKDPKDLANKLIKFIEIPHEQKKEMGIAGRKKMESEFDRRIVVNAYLDEINNIIGDKSNVTL